MDDACQAARDGRLEYFEALPESKVAALIKQTDEDGRTLLHNATAGKSADLSKWLLGLGADCNTADDEVLVGKSPPCLSGPFPSPSLPPGHEAGDSKGEKSAI